MKKITLLIILFVVSIGYSQTLLQGFESGGVNGGPFGGMPVPVIEAGSGSNTSQVLKIVTNTGGEPWQGININLSPSTNLTVNKTLTIDVLSSSPITFLVKVNAGGPEAAAPVTHNGDGTWQTLSFTFNTSLDGKAEDPTGIYAGFVIHPYWEVGRTDFFNPTVVPKPARTFYIDNIREPAPVGPVTGDVYINDGTFAAGDFTTAAGQDIATNDGSAAEPFTTLAYALARSTQAPGDVIYIDAGTYSWASTHALTDSGTLANPITMQGKGSDETNITTTAANTTSAGLHFTTGEHWVVKDLNWTATAARTVWVDGVADITLDNCTFNMTSLSAIQSIIINNAAGELTIKNSRLTRSNTAYHMVEVVEGTTLIMQDNTSSFSALAGVGTASSVQLRTNASSLFIIERNKFVNGGYGIGNVAGTAGPVNGSSIIKNNFFKSFWGIVTTIAQGLTVHNNSFYTNGESIFGVGGGNLTNWDIRNNILYTYGATKACVMSGSATSHPAIMDYNHYYSPNTGAARQGSTSGPILSFTAWQGAAGGPWETNGQGGNATSFDPLYVDAANGDLHLQPGSPAIGAGVDVGISDDIDGDARPLSGSFDMGADEFAATVSCDAALGITSATCDTFGVGATDDTYTATVDFTNGLNGNVYVVAASSGTVGGDDPNLVASGTISVSGIAEGTDITVIVDDTADGGECSLSASITSPDCIPPPSCNDGILNNGETAIDCGGPNCAPCCAADLLREDFDGVAPLVNIRNGGDGAPSTGAASVAIINDPTGAGKGNVFQIITESADLPWQQAELILQNDFNMSSANRIVTIDWYSNTAFEALLGLNASTTSTSPSTTAEAAHTGNGWETLEFDFTVPAQNGGQANGVYRKIFFFPHWNIVDGDFNNPFVGLTSYLDNIYEGPIVKTTYTYNNGGWLPSDPAGNSGCNDILNIVAVDLTMTADVEVDTITIAPGASLTVDSGVTLTARSVNLNSTSSTFSSLIVDGTLNGTVSYSRYTTVLGTNDLIASPVSGQDFGPFAEANPNLAFNPTPGDETEKAFAPFNTGTGNYENYDSVANAGTTISSGMGFRAATTDGSNLIFSGTALNSDVLDISISDAALGNAWNLIGNPYPSYLDFASFFTTENKAQFDPGGAFQAIYGYNGNGWTVWNQATIVDTDETELIAPGQAFYVKSKAMGGVVDFTTVMRVAGNSDDFIAGRTSNDLNVAASKLILSRAENSTYTRIYFIEGNTRGLDQGYDAGAYEISSENFSIFTNLVENNQGLDMAIQTLGHEDFHDVVIPLGVKASNEGELTIGLSPNSSLPANINVYLEDTQNTTLTLLNNSDYTFLPSEDLTGTGRFFLRYASSALSLQPNDGLNELIIYTNNTNKDIIIKGLLTNDTTTDLYDIQGRLVLNKKLDQSLSTQSIDISSMSTGVYIIKVSSISGNKTQKLIIK